MSTYYIRDSTTGLYSYSQDVNGNEQYDYSKIDKDIFIDERYAKNANLDEIYPFVNNEPIFITDIITKKQTYAKKSNGDEFYPRDAIQTVDLLAEIDGVKKYYAKKSNGEHFYPLDEYENEYVDFGVAPVDVYVNDQYPITNDNLIIVPGDTNGNPDFKFTFKPKVEQKNLKGRLYRTFNKFTDYVSNVTASRISRSTVRRKYTIRTSGWLSYVIYMLLFVLLGATAVLYFRKR